MKDKPNVYIPWRDVDQLIQLLEDDIQYTLEKIDDWRTKKPRPTQYGGQMAIYRRELSMSEYVFDLLSEQLGAAEQSGEYCCVRDGY